MINETYQVEIAVLYKFGFWRKHTTDVVWTDDNPFTVAEVKERAINKIKTEVVSDEISHFLLISVSKVEK